MRDLNEDSNSCSWPVFYGDKTFPNGQYYNGFLPRILADAYPGYDKDVVKQIMLEHEAIFRHQVYELHRLYSTQRNLMDEIKRKELGKNWIPMETSLSSSPLTSKVTYEGVQKWNVHGFPLANTVCARPSISGAKENHSPFGSFKGNTGQDALPYQNGSSSKDIDVLESRPTKFQKKMIDLQLPADEYIDTEEEEPSRRGKNHNHSSHGNSTNIPQSSTKLFHGDGGRNCLQEDALRSVTCVREISGLADLNKPVHDEEPNLPTYIELLGRSSCLSEIRGQEQYDEIRSHRSNNGRLNTSQLQNNGNGSGWFPHVHEGVHNRSNQKSNFQIQLEKWPTSSLPVQVRSSNEHNPSLLYRPDQSKKNHLWWESTTGGFEISGKTSGLCNYNHPESVSSLSQKMISDRMHPYLNLSANLSRTYQSSNQGHGTYSGIWNLNSSSNSNAGFGNEIPYQNGFHHGSSSGSKLSVPLPSVEYDILNCSSDNAASEHFINHSSTKHCKSSNCLDMDPANDLNLNTTLSNSSSNEAAPQQCLGVTDRETKQEDYLAVLPWLRSKSGCNTEAGVVGNNSNLRESSFFLSSRYQSSVRSETRKVTSEIFSQKIKSCSWSDDVDSTRTGIDGSPGNKKIEYPIFEKHHVSNNQSSLTSPIVPHHQSECEVVEANRKIRTLDINLPCDSGIPDFSNPIAIIEKQMHTKVSNFRHEIDLNSCISEDEDTLISSTPISKVNATILIDLEVPPVFEPEEDAITVEALEKNHEGPTQLPQKLPDDLHSELIIVAAEAIVSISSSDNNGNLNDTTLKQLEVSAPDPLHWFAEIVSSSRDELYNSLEAVLTGKDDEDTKKYSSEEFDYFESMTLQLTETEAKDYMPKPLVPENLLLEEPGGTSLRTRPRRGQARRGRQRRDFQRDILPGLTSLSRHEVTEDLQTFGGLMRATGQVWPISSVRRNSARNGCARGRRRSVCIPSPAAETSPHCTPLVQQLNNVELGLEDRSLAGWGKTTRRPRRQRGPAGNPSSLPLA